MDPQYYVADGYLQQNFNAGDFFDALGNTIQAGVENVGSNFNANATNAQAIANLNNAQAAAVLSRAENQRQITRTVGMVLIISIVAIVLVTLLKPVFIKMFK